MGTWSYAKLPPRHVAAQAVLLHPTEDRVLVLRMQGQEGGRLPGGPCAPDESAIVAVRRIVKLQLGILVPFGGADLAVVDYAPPTPRPEAPEGYTFVFVRRLSAEHAGLARPQDAAGPELLGFEWAMASDLESVCRPRLVRRITRAVAIAEVAQPLGRFLVRGHVAW